MFTPLTHINSQDHKTNYFFFFFANNIGTSQWDFTRLMLALWLVAFRSHIFLKENFKIKAYCTDSYMDMDN